MPAPCPYLRSGYFMTRRRSPAVVAIAFVLVVTLPFTQQRADAFMTVPVVTMLPSVFAEAAVYAGAATTAFAGAMVAGAAATGIGVGYGVVESGLWDWATTDPVDPTIQPGGWASDYFTEDARYLENFLTSPYWHHDFTNIADSSVTSWAAGYDVSAEGQRDDGTPQGATSSMTTSPGTTHKVRTCSEAECPDGPYQLWERVWINGVAQPWSKMTELEPSTVEDRRVRLRADCKDQTGAVVGSIDEVTPLYAPGSEPMTPAGSCPAGSFVDNASIVREVDGDPSLDEDLMTYTAPDAFTNPDPDLADCMPGGQHAPCVLMLHKVIDGESIDCREDTRVNCAGWSTLPLAERTATYECLWMPSVPDVVPLTVPLEECDLYAPTFDPQTEGEVTTEPITPTDPALLPQVDPDLEQSCGHVQTWQDLTPWAMTGAMGCVMAHTWTETVPTVMTEQFVPDPATLEPAITQFTTTFQETPPANLFTPVADFIPGVFGPIGGPTTSCGGYLWEFDPPQMDQFYVTDPDAPRLGIPCAPPWDHSVPMATMKTMIIVGTIWGLWNIVGATFGGPTMNTTPGDVVASGND